MATVLGGVQGSSIPTTGTNAVDWESADDKSYVWAALYNDTFTSEDSNYPIKGTYGAIVCFKSFYIILASEKGVLYSEGSLLNAYYIAKL